MEVSSGGGAEAWASRCPPVLGDGTAALGLRLRSVLILAAIVGLAATLRLELLTTRSLWIDEALSLDISSAGPSGIVAISRTAEPHPPGYYLLLWSWQRVLGEHFVTARALSMAFGIISVVLTWAVGRRLFGDLVGLGAAALVAVHPFQVFASNEVRMYPLLTVVGLAATLALSAAIHRRDNAWPWVAYGLLASAVAYTSYYGFLLLAGHGLGVLLELRGTRAWRGPALALGTAVLSYGAWLPYLVPSLTSNPVPWRPEPPWWYPFAILSTQTFGGHLFGTPAYHASAPPSLLWLVPGVPFAAFLVVGLATARRTGFGGLLVTCSWLVPVALVLAASVSLRKVVAYNYHLTHLQPYAALLVAMGVERLTRCARTSRRIPVAAGLSAVGLGILAGALWVAQTGSREVYRFDLAARMLAERRAPGDVTIYMTATGQRVLRRYLTARGPEVAVAPSPHRWTLEATRPLLEAAVRPIGSKYRRVWLVLTPPFPEGSVETLLELLQQRGFRAHHPGTSFGGIFVQLLER